MIRNCKCGGQVIGDGSRLRPRKKGEFPHLRMNVGWIKTHALFKCNKCGKKYEQKVRLPNGQLDRNDSASVAKAPSGRTTLLSPLGN